MQVVVDQSIDDIDGLLPEILSYSSEAIAILEPDGGSGLAAGAAAFRYVYANPAAKRLGLPFAAVYARLYSKALSTQQPELVSEAGFRHRIVPLKNKRGQYRYVLTITENGQAGKLMESLCSSSDEALMITDLNGRVLKVNDMFSDMFGWTAEELADSNLLNVPFVPAPILHEGLQLRERILRGEQIRSHCTQRISKHGEVMDVTITLRPVFDGMGQTMGIMATYRDQREKLRQEQQLLESERRYRRLFDLSLDPVAIHRDGEILRVNQAMLTLTGVGEPNELVGKSIFQFIHPGDWSMAQDRIHSMLAGGEPLQPAEIRLIRPDGRAFLAEIHASPISIDGAESILTICRDITERKATEERLRENRLKYQIITEHMTDLVAVYDAQGMMTFASPSHETLLGWEPSVLLGKSLLHMAHPEDVAAVMKTFHQLVEAREETKGEFRLLHADGESDVLVDVTGSVIEDENGEIGSILIVSRDIRERKFYEEKLKELAYYDKLTGLPNRRYFEEYLGRELSFAVRHKMSLALMYMDLDGFKAVNDTQGHAAGDEVLIEFSSAVDRCLRESDFLARLGGDEFVAILPDCSEEDVVGVADRILQQLSTLPVNVSIGISAYPRDGSTRDTLLKLADEAMYRAKAAGKCQYKLA